MQLKPGPGWWAQYLAGVQQRLPLLTPGSLSEVMWALGALGQVPGQGWLEAFAAAALQQLAGFDANMLARLAWSLAAVELAPSSTFTDTFLAASRSLLAAGSFSAHALALLMGGLAQLRVQPGEAWMQLYYTQLLDCLGECRGVHLARTLSSLASLDCSPPTPLLHACLAAAALRMRHQDLDPGAAAELAWAAQRLHARSRSHAPGGVEAEQAWLQRLAQADPQQGRVGAGAPSTPLAHRLQQQHVPHGLQQGSPQQWQQQRRQQAEWFLANGIAVPQFLALAAAAGLMPPTHRPNTSKEGHPAGQGASQLGSSSSRSSRSNRGLVQEGVCAGRAGVGSRRRVSWPMKSLMKVVWPRSKGQATPAAVQQLSVPQAPARKHQPDMVTNTAPCPRHSSEVVISGDGGLGSKCGTPPGGHESSRVDKVGAEERVGGEEGGSKPASTWQQQHPVQLQAGRSSQVLGGSRRGAHRTPDREPALR
ncbi:hypothetical protein V8C86DRAFT_2533982 [Haematococcus lacustris]